MSRRDAIGVVIARSVDVGVGVASPVDVGRQISVNTNVPVMSGDVDVAPSVEVGEVQWGIGRAVGWAIRHRCRPESVRGR